MNCLWFLAGYLSLIPLKSDVHDYVGQDSDVQDAVRSVTDDGVVYDFGSFNVSNSKIRTLDLGELEVGVPQSLCFVVQNDSASKLIVEEIGVSCGCTKVDADSKEVDPGEEISFRFRISAATEPKKTEYSVLLRFNSAELNFQLKGKSVLPFAITPERLNFTKEGNSYKATFEVAPRDGFASSIVKVTCGNERLDIAELEDRGGGKMLVTINTKSDWIAEAETTIGIVVSFTRTTGESKSQLVVLQGLVEGAFSVKPKILRLSLLDGQFVGKMLISHAPEANVRVEGLDFEQEIRPLDDRCIEIRKLASRTYIVLRLPANLYDLARCRGVVLSTDKAKLVVETKID
jgi:hypothetical protein